ncbi:MAG: class I SAM-dependent methyltransferase [Proteobacteria bacterium]|nr:class I SAM-dependent methyltransferase [Pseudomonadota bacterium]
MYSHSERWKKAQELEKVYWQKDFFRDSEYKELIFKYADLFKQIEQKYNFSEDTTVLDLGCGATCPSTLFSKGKRFGVDPIVSGYLEKDRQKLDGVIQLSEGTGEEIPFEDGYFDVVLCRNALDHMDNIDNVMKEIDRVLKPSGIVILSIYTYSPFIAFLKKASELVPMLRNIEHPFTFTPPQFRRFCAATFDILDEIIVFEGKSSIDYGKQDVELSEPLSHKIFSWINRYLFMNRWFLREMLITCRKQK